VEWINRAPADLFENMPVCEGGAFRLMERPGHGITLPADAEKK
jgi:L-alanine-DL-glutamate epimerase-like enolase superfamily enzyme